MRTTFLISFLGLTACSSSPISQYCASLATCAMDDCELSAEACEELRQSEQDICEAELKGTRDVIATGTDESCSNCIEALDRYYQCAADIPTCTDFYNAQADDCDGEYIEYAEACSAEVQEACGRESGEDTGGLTLTGTGTLPSQTSSSNSTAPTDTTTPCNNSVVSTYPEAGEAGVFYRTSVEFRLAVEDPTAFVTLAASGGSAVNGSSSVDGSMVTFTPDDPLTPDREYTATLNWSCEPSVSVSWVTSEVGDAVEPSDLVGRSYAISLASGRFIEPPGIGSLLASLIEFNMLIGVTYADSDELRMRGSLSSDASSTEQDLCVPTLDYPAADFSLNPYFEMVTDSLPLEISGMETTFENVVLSGAVASDFSRVEGATMRAEIDTRAFVAMIDPDGDAGTFCDLLATFTVDCEACADGSGEYCMTLHIDSMVGEERRGAPLVEVTEVDVMTNPACDEYYY